MNTGFVLMSKIKQDFDSLSWIDFVSLESISDEMIKLDIYLKCSPTLNAEKESQLNDACFALSEKMNRQVACSLHDSRSLFDRVRGFFNHQSE